MFQIEQVLQGRYKLKQLLGQNAGRQTWLAEDLEAISQSQVIVKLLAFSPQMQWDELKLFEREAQVLRNLNHARIPRYCDYFSVDEETGYGLRWFGLVHEYIPGYSLRELLEKGQRFTETEVQKIAINFLNILIYLHELSPPVIHRDIKPSNLIMGEDKQVYLVDFGAVQDRARAEGVTFTVVGTSGYAPPEQLWGKAVPASDLYALGATLIHLLTGTAPADLPQRQMRIQFTDQVKLSPHFSNWLEQLIEPAPEQRFHSAREALLALEEESNPVKPVATIRRFTDSTVNYKRLASLGILPLGFVGLLATIVIPPLLNGADKAKQMEAKLYISSMNRAQQAYFLENETFSHSIPRLGLGIKTYMPNYNYSTHATKTTAFNYAISKNSKLRGYVGGVFLLPYQDGNKVVMRTQAILCEGNKPGNKMLRNPVYKNGVILCAPGTRNISR